MLLARPDLLAGLMGKFLRFLCFNESDQVVTNQYNRHIFGAKSSPTCVNFALQRCALDNAYVFERSSRIASHYFYMDDLLVSQNSEKKAVDFKLESKELYAKVVLNSKNGRRTSTEMNFMTKL